ncbi:transposase [Actinophytocola sp.]|uniref:transposase n=1 Tax=Actinophytocola sp. TaxID=1872138 RepID=UPI00389AD2AF
MGRDRVAAGGRPGTHRPFRPRAPGQPEGSCGILFVLYTAFLWEFLPVELGPGSGMTCWRLRDWNDAGVWQRLHE